MKVRGIGINDAEYPVSTSVCVTNDKGEVVRKCVTLCPFYERWSNMLTRCYSKSHLSKYPTYLGCSVCEQWLTFSNFKKWMEKQNWEGKHLDKDLLFPGNKLYSPDTCVFVNPDVNYFILVGKENGLPTGVSVHKRSGKYRAQCNDPISRKRVDLGLYESQDSAHNAWLSCKRSFANELALLQDDDRVRAALINRYKEIT